ncbi:MAG: hypothetical protein OEU26_36925 [Candidatus Tectomicrobia bacterium]|nr:hypothetical protein [Candidatus Tectomicrobia bacterium]
MRYRLVSGLALCCLWLMTAVPNVMGADMAHFQAMQLTRLPEAVALPDVRLLNVEGKAVSLRSFRDQVVLVNFWTTW